MNSHVRFPLALAFSVIAATAVHARGPSPQPWMIYPSKVMDTCRTGSAPQHIAPRCHELLQAYSRALEACVPMRRGGPVLGENQIALQASAPECAAAAARNASKTVK